ncbi:hypothetical protein CCP3SC15_6310002 [Gammaproteobacteria bacterium]
MRGELEEILKLLEQPLIVEPIIPDQEIAASGR